MSAKTGVAPTCRTEVAVAMNVIDGTIGLKAFAAEVARSPKTNVAIHRTLVDGDDKSEPRSARHR